MADSEQLTLIPKGIPTKVEIKSEWIQERDRLLESMPSEVTDQDSWDEAGVALNKITKLNKELETQRKGLAKPFKDTDKKIKSIADHAAASLEVEKQRLKEAMQTYREQLEQQRQQEMEEKAQEAAQAETPFDEEVAKQEAEQPETQTPRQSATKTVKVVKFQVSNPDQVPREYCSPDERLIRHAVQKAGVAEIPGVQIWEENEIRSK